VEQWQMANGKSMPLPLSFATFRAPESESVIRHLDVIRIRQAGKPAQAACGSRQKSLFIFS
jgi:hypothetical protein